MQGLAEDIFELDYCWMSGTQKLMVIYCNGFYNPDASIQRF